MNYKISYGLSLMSAFCILFISCSVAKADNQPEIERTINIDKNFTGLHATTIFDITYTQNSSDPVAILTGPKNLVDKVEFTINSDGILKFSINVKSLNNAPRISVCLNGGALNCFEASSSGTLNVTTPIDTDKLLNIDASSSGEIVIQKGINAKGKTNLSASSSGEINLQDVVSSILYAESSSAGDIFINNCLTSKINTESSSSGAIRFNQCFTDSFSANVSSAGNIQVSGCEIKTLNCEASSAGSASFSGRADKGSFEASSEANIQINNLQLQNLISLETSSGGRIQK